MSKKRREIDVRLKELKPMIEDYERLAGRGCRTLRSLGVRTTAKASLASCGEIDA